MTYGVTAGIWAAALSNVFFFGLHARNYIKARSSDMEIMKKQIAAGWQVIQDQSHGLAVEAGWWTDLETGQPKERNVGELLMLIVSEVAEGMEGHRKNLMDDKLPHRSMLEVELADAVIRIGDLAGKLGLDVGGAIGEKMAFNAIRPDHKIETRKLAEGKKY
jgi:NTP pyrophosphatase (non-canonical NTP hydrolase)